MTRIALDTFQIGNYRRVPVYKIQKEFITMNKKAKVSKKVEPENEEVVHTFPYEFLDMLTDTASNTLSEYLKKSKIEGAEDVRLLFDMTCCLYLEQIHLMGGLKQDVENVTDIVARTVHHISALNGTWYAPTGDVTPLKELQALWESKK